MPGETHAERKNVSRGALVSRDQEDAGSSSVAGGLNGDCLDRLAVRFVIALADPDAGIDGGAAVFFHALDDRFHLVRLGEEARLAECKCDREDDGGAESPWQ